MKNKIKNLKSTNTKEYWKLINMSKKNNNATKISIEVLHDFFKYPKCKRRIK